MFGKFLKSTTSETAYGGFCAHFYEQKDCYSTNFISIIVILGNVRGGGGGGGGGEKGRGRGRGPI